MLRSALTARSSSTPLDKRWTSLKSLTARATPADVTFEPERYSLNARDRLASLWRMRMESEYQSSAVFAALAPQLMAARAPIDVQAAALSGAHDELRHGEYCAQILTALSALPACNALIEPPMLPRHEGATAEARALRNMVFGSCVSEVVNASRFGDALDVITDPYLRDVTRLILADEIAHGQLGFFYLASIRDWLQAHPEVRADVGEYLSRAFYKYEKDTLASLALVPQPTSEERELGLTDPARDLLIFTQTIEHAVIPGLMTHGIDAQRAWETRANGRT